MAPASGWSAREGTGRFIVAIPAHDEEERIEACLSALATQRDRFGAPVPAGLFEVLIYANNCIDGTARTARRMAGALPFRLVVVEGTLPPGCRNAGHARKVAMDLAADRLAETIGPGRAVLTTDADSRVGPTWINATAEAFEAGADCVAGYIDADPVEIMRLGPDFLARGRLEDRYLRLVAEITARCDPRPHDPWPCHRVASGASLAVTLDAYRAIGGLPALALGEDAALARRLDADGFRVRHALDIHVTTSCRFDGRAAGGAADTMKLRHAVPDAPCDDDLEGAAQTFRRARLRGDLRRASAAADGGRFAGRLGLDPGRVERLRGMHAGRFADLWQSFEACSPALRRSSPLRPSSLPVEIARAERLLARLDRGSGPAQPFEPIDVALQAAARETVAERFAQE